MKSYVEYNGKKYDTICGAVETAPDTVESMTIRIYDTNGSYEYIELERGRAGDIIYTAYDVLDGNGEVYVEEINTAAEAAAIAEEIGGTAYATEQTIYERIECTIID